MRLGSLSPSLQHVEQYLLCVLYIHFDSINLYMKEIAPSVFKILALFWNGSTITTSALLILLHDVVILKQIKQLSVHIHDFSRQLESTSPFQHNSKLWNCHGQKCWQYQGVRKQKSISLYYLYNMGLYETLYTIKWSLRNPTHLDEATREIATLNPQHQCLIRTGTLTLG